MGKKKTTTTNDPWKPAQPYIIKGMEQTQRVFDQQQPQLDKYSGLAFDTYGKLNPGAVAGIQGSQTLVNDTLSGKYLNSNPYLDSVLGQQVSDIQDGVSGQFSAGGRYGSGAHAGVLAKQIAEASDRMRYQNYAQERQNQMAAVGQAQDLMRGNQATLEQAAALPWTGVAAQTGNIRQASNGYGTTTTTTRDPMGAVMGLAGAGATALSGTNFSDPRIKSKVRPLGQRPDGLGIYEYDNDLTGKRETGVMADEVAQKRPDALGPTVGGLATVDYDKLKADMPEVAKVQQPGVAGYLDRVLSPDTSTTAGKLGLFGQALMANSGSAFAPLGQSLLALRADERQRADDAADEQHRAAQLALQGRIAEQRNAPEALDPDAGWQVVQDRFGRIMRANRYTGKTEVLQEPPAGAVTEPLVATSEGYLPRSQAVGKTPYRAPARGGGGGLTANQAAQIRAQAAEAIAKGADPAKVRARMAEMGVN